MGSGELTQAVRPNEDCVSCMNDSRLDDAGDDCAYERDGEGVIDVEFEWGVSVVIAVMWENIEEGADEVQRLASDVRDLEHGADALGDKLGGSLNSIGAVFDEDGNFPCARRLKDAGQLGDGLLQDMIGTDVNFGNDYHHRNIKGQGDTKVLS